MRAPPEDGGYARALFAIASDEGPVDPSRAELLALSAACADHGELRDAVFRPLHPGAERRAVLKQVCEHIGTSPVVQNFCSFLVDQRRVVDFEAIRLAYEDLADREAGRTRARVTSASALTADQRGRLCRALAARTGQQVAPD